MKYYEIIGSADTVFVFAEGLGIHFVWSPVENDFSMSWTFPKGIDAIKVEIDKQEAVYLAMKEVQQWHVKAGDSNCTGRFGISWKDWMTFEIHPLIEQLIKIGFPLASGPDYYCRLYDVRCDKKVRIAVCKIRKSLTGKKMYYFWDPKTSTYSILYDRRLGICSNHFEETISHEYADWEGAKSFEAYERIVKKYVEMSWSEWIEQGYYYWYNKTEKFCRFEDRIIPLGERPEDIKVLEEKAKSGRLIDLDKLAERYIIFTRSRSVRKAAEITIKALTMDPGFGVRQRQADSLPPPEKTAWGNCIKRIQHLYVNRRREGLRDLFTDKELSSWLCSRYPDRSRDEEDFYESPPKLSDYYDDIGELELNTTGDGFD